MSRAPALLPVVERSRRVAHADARHVTPALVRRALPEAAVGPGHDSARAVVVTGVSGLYAVASS